MRRLTAFIAMLLSITTLAFAQSGTKRYVYLGMPAPFQCDTVAVPARCAMCECTRMDPEMFGILKLIAYCKPEWPILWAF